MLVPFIVFNSMHILRYFKLLKKRWRRMYCTYIESWSPSLSHVFTAAAAAPKGPAAAAAAEGPAAAAAEAAASSPA
jgi:hypothetical protein